MTLIHIVRQNKKTIIVLVSAIIILTTAILLITFLSQKFIRGSVVANGYACSNIGRQILEKGGTAADAAIAALFCEGAVMPQSMGLGGGFLLTFYQHSTREAWSLNSREVAPLKATQDMYGDNGNKAKFVCPTGGKAIAVPGELLGYWSLYNKFGKGVSWKELIQPTIDLCENGIYVSEYLATKLKNNHQKINSDPELSATFINPNTNSTYNNGDYFKHPKLAKTLRVIAEEGGTALNNGSLTKSLVQDIQSVDGIITEEDMNIYKPVWTRPAEATLLNDQKLFSSPLPGSGQILIFILNILDGFLDTTKLYSITNYQRIVESFKYGYGQRTKLGDKHDAQTQQILSNLMSKDFAKHTRTLIYDNETYDSVLHYGANSGIVNDQGTAHISVLAPNGDAVAVTSTINGVFGAYYASPSTGIILNNQMDDFSSPGFHNLYNLPPSPANFIEPGKRPLSSMCPTIILDKNGDVLMVIGASGGSKITTTVAQIIIKNLWFGLDLKTAMQSSRLHHQLIPNVIMFEESFNIQHKSIVDGLKKIGHNITFSPPDEGFAAAVAISSGQKQVYGESDIRRPGSTSFIFGY